MPTSKKQVLAISGMGVYGKVANYSALPDPTLHDGETWIALASQGTSWLPGALFGTFYDKGYYYSNGTTWTYNSSPYQATQSDVNAGLIDDQFVSPNTLKNSTQWATKEDAVTPTTIADYYRGDKTFQPLNKAAVGLSNADNTSDLNKPISTATQTALNLKEDKYDYQIKNVAYTLLTTDGTVEVTVAGATQTFHTAVGNLNKKCRIINASNGVVRADTTSSQTIGNSSVSNPTFIDLQPEEWLDVISNGTNWRMI